MYPYGASSVKCAVCQFVTNVNVSTPFTSPWLSTKDLTISSSVSDSVFFSS